MIALIAEIGLPNIVGSLNKLKRRTNLVCLFIYIFSKEVKKWKSIQKSGGRNG